MTADQVILAQDCIYSTDSETTGINNNVLVVGGSGSGKTMSVAEPRLLTTFHNSLIVTVTKKRIVKKYKPLFQSRGYKVYDLDFVNPKQGNIGYDPLMYVHTYKDIAFLAESVVKANPRKGTNTTADPYWDDAAISLLSAEIAFTMMFKNDATFSDVLDMNDHITFKEAGEHIQTNYDEAFDTLEQRNPTCFAVSCWKTFHQLSFRTASCIFSVLNTTIDTVFSKEIRSLMSTSQVIDFKGIALRRSVLFVTTSPVNPALNCFINIFYGNIFKELFEFAERQPDGMLPTPVHVLCDDFATGGRIPNFQEYISIFREKGLSVTLMLQSESQLEGLYGANAATTIINNCDTYLYMGSMDLMTGKNVSMRLNAPLAEVLYMPIGQVALFRRGQRPIITQRYNIQSNQLYQMVTEQYERQIFEQSEILS